MTDEARRPEDHQACAHPRVLYTTEQIEGGRTRGWWACDLCLMKFTPVASAEYAVAQAVLVDRERVTTLEQAIKEHTCSSSAAWCARCGHFHVSPHGLPLLCAALRRELAL